MEQTTGDRRVYRTTPGDFGMSLLVLIAAVMKADGKVLKSELDYVKRFFVSQFGPETAQEALQMLRDLLKQDIPLRDVCMQIRRNMDYPSRLQLIHILYNISAADNRFETAETNVIRSIADMLGITSTDYDSIRNMFIPATDAAYRILEVERSATDEELKSAYRKWHSNTILTRSVPWGKTSGKLQKRSSRQLTKRGENQERKKYCLILS
jgi:DnaJ like chaperone protein